MFAEYQTVFEITDKGFPWWPTAVGLGFVGWFLLIVRYGHKRNQRYKIIFGYLMAAFMLMLTALTFALMYTDYRNLKRAYERGDYKVVEGRVENFRPMPFEGHTNESFTVQGVKFSYSDYYLIPGFNKTSSHGGPIREGLQVRIAYRNGTILRLEIKPDSTPSVHSQYRWDSHNRGS